MPRELILLTAYTPPTLHALMLGAEDTGNWLNGWSALWHPAALAGCESLPRWSSPYDHDPPVAGHLYAVPETPTLYVTEDWDSRVRHNGAAAFRASTDRTATLARLREALEQIGADTSACDWPVEAIRPFLALGLGYAIIETLYEAMEHERLLDRAGFLADLQAAIQDRDHARDHLIQAARKLLSARESVYASTIHLLDLALLDDQAEELQLPPAARGTHAANLIATGNGLERLAREQPEAAAELRARLHESDGVGPRLEICGGIARDRPDELLPLESQLWNLRQGRHIARRLFDVDVEVYASRRGTFHPQSPTLLQQAGLPRALLLAFDEGRLPSHRGPVVQWPAADGRQVEALARTPLPADDPQTFFHLAHHLHQTIQQDSTACLAFLHRGALPPAPVYDDLLCLSDLAPVLGLWTTASQYLRDGIVGEYASTSNADDFTLDALEPRCDRAKQLPPRDPQSPAAVDDPPGDFRHPVALFPRHLRQRRRIDAMRVAWTLHRSLGGAWDRDLLEAIDDLEGRLEQFEPIPENALAGLEARAAGPLVDRLLSRASGQDPGLMLINPCAFTRRITLERDDFTALPPIDGPVRAAQQDGPITRLVVEVPPLGFVWISRAGGSGGKAPRRPLKLADARGVRNEFFEADVDPATGGLRSLRDPRTRENRLGQQLVFQPGSRMVGKEVKLLSTGPALGEVMSVGALLDEHDNELATFRQRFRAWLGRPLLEMRIDLIPRQPPQGYPWHAYYGARFAWRDERATLIRGSQGLTSVTTQTRPMTPDFLELRLGRQRTLLLPGGLPFHQRHGLRMLDVLLVPPGETATRFDLALGLDREQPMQTAWGYTSPVLAISVDRGPPHVGPAGWLFHLDSPNLMMTSMVPESADALSVQARFLELTGFAGAAELRCPVNPRSAETRDGLGFSQQSLWPQGDAIPFDYAANDLINLRIEF